MQRYESFFTCKEFLKVGSWELGVRSGELGVGSWELGVGSGELSSWDRGESKLLWLL